MTPRVRPLNHEDGDEGERNLTLTFGDLSPPGTAAPRSWRAVAYLRRTRGADVADFAAFSCLTREFFSRVQFRSDLSAISRRPHRGIRARQSAILNNAEFVSY